MPIQCGGAESVPGEIVRGKLIAGSLLDGSLIHVPLLIAEGVKPGPTVWINACTHGEEYGGAAAITRFFQSLNLQQLSGTVVGVPVSNPPAFGARSRYSPLDGANLNRLFPGDVDGSYSYQLAALLSAEMARVSDYLLDLHSGGIGAAVPFYAVYMDDGSPPVVKTRELAMSIGCSVLWRAEGDALGGTFAAQAIRSGIPSLIVEVGGGTVTEAHLGDYANAMTNFLKALEMLPGHPPAQHRYTIVSDGAFLHCREGGLFVPDCELGAFLSRGETLGHIINLYGDTVEEIQSPCDDAYIAALRTPYYPVSAGELVGEAVPVESIETPSG